MGSSGSASSSRGSSGSGSHLGHTHVETDGWRGRKVEHHKCSDGSYKTQSSENANDGKLARCRGGPGTAALRTLPGEFPKPLHPLRNSKRSRARSRPCHLTRPLGFLACGTPRAKARFKRRWAERPCERKMPVGAARHVFRRLTARDQAATTLRPTIASMLPMRPTRKPERSRDLSLH